MEQSHLEVSEQTETAAGIAFYRRAQAVHRGADTNENRMAREMLCLDITAARKAGGLSEHRAADLQGYVRHHTASSFIRELADATGDQPVEKGARPKTAGNGDAVAAATEQVRGNWLRRWTGGLLG